ncbi:endonuclease/exonuclease/phosphatase family protein [Fusobacterium perfoetens]|uniref:endonuclease/exonuclease/phosphatase family protein n=1 Tax=Fusobacterium perfoetens TaxID=852 RepID=UPI001F39C80B|nr:endonuclease/exonuclease/phosphatase family protein [Fusobacterium perfoetens]MCF2625479.1 endonuclease/exonuclease/phosphatase family protein [Fusobacterium perfoetens]
MKKILTIFFIFVSLTIYSSPKEKAYIGSFNALRLGESEKDYKELSNILVLLDLIGLEEVSNREGVETLVDELEKNTHEKWNYHISPYPVGTKKYKEYYAYIWKENKVKFLKSKGFYKDNGDKFIREPYGVDFKIGEFDFTFVIIHSIYGKNKSVRTAEAMNLDKVYDYFQSSDKKENDIIIGGDFNLSVRSEGFKNLLSHRDKITNCISPNMKTTIGTKGYANQYDNIFISEIYTKEYTGRSGGIDTANGNYKKTRKLISDHIPVFIEVNTSKDDD